MDTKNFKTHTARNYEYIRKRFLPNARFISAYHGTRISLIQRLVKNLCFQHLIHFRNQD